jgi:hypothetical protein
MQALAANPAPCTAPRVQLPRSSSRLGVPHVYVKLVERIRMHPWGPVYDGKIYRPGAVLESAAIPRPAVAIECAGPVGVWQRGKHRPLEYIVWRYDFAAGEWLDLARAQALGVSWASMVHEAIYLALHPRADLLDIIARSRSLADQVIAEMNGRLADEMDEVRRTALYAIYERIAGELAICA